ncbi:hypothetical protein [Senegalia sp. (in: firmicutes)]|uniref:hypothetical protein n=1 Tax=Senegalia sp. (in: firmicutes) TaxID=1924098 RepID=UPI003F946516
MSNIKYLRKFIMLEKLNSNTKIKGHSKIEVRDGRGKVEVNIDSITDVNKVYDIIFLTNEGFKDDVAYFGTISDVGGGKAFYKKDFNPKNVLHSDKAIDDYNIIAIKSSDSEILYGYIHKKEDKDIVSLLTEKQEKRTEVKKEEIEEVEEVEEVKEVEEEIKVENQDEEEEQEQEIQELEEEKEEFKEETHEEEISEEEISKEETEDLEEVVEESFEIKEEDKIKKEETYFPNADSNLDDYILSKSEKDLEEYYRYKEYKTKENIDNYKKEYKSNETNYKTNSLDILNYFNQVDPFKINLKEYNFWEITEDSVIIRRGFLPFYNYVVNMKYPYTLMHQMNSPSKQIRKYRHYLFGIVSEDESNIKHFVYGVPGVFTRNEQPFRGMSGFTTWLESKDSGDERLGYWLIHIDAVTGRIITPLRPTSPLK